MNLPKTRKEIELFCMLLNINDTKKNITSNNPRGYMGEHYANILKDKLEKQIESYLKLANENN